ncbi:HDOD domain-containing protein [Pseudoxanthomonas composti]|uniref:HDOD domain-containing protein n=1 Tax=Pseudoxanthomonas composti TaxID=2137479 RepID=A0A4Q1JZM9_9GAMM|nr:HDOD domain-containing protein [Pseudoxanthomonas composti]RXR08815.1 HDOD domain-containing protein [Pseudoxanthomonas composti]
MRILFVGDAACFPAELIELVGEMDDQWQARVVADGSTALGALASEAVDMVVVAPEVGDMPAATLLGQIRTLRPETSRLALVDASQPPANKIIGLAHRFLPYPLAPEVLLEAIGSLDELRELIDNPELRSRIGRVDQLPSPPHIYLSLVRALDDDAGASAADISRLISGDPAIAAKVLQICNSAFFSNGRTISDLRTAVTRLGTGTLRDLVLASEVFSMPAAPGIDRHLLQQRALLASRQARRILPESSAELGATAALLADIGLLLPGVRNVYDTPDAPEGDTRPAHTEAGAYLLGLWGLPMPIIEAVAFHREPQRSSTRTFWVTGAVHVAMSLASNSPIDEAYLAKTGMLARLEGWRQDAEAQGAKAEA